MFRRLTEPLPLSEASLLLLRPAMNAPVLNVGYLPIGPARAAVVAFAEEYGGIGIALGLRAADSGQIAVLRNPESIDFDVPLAEALEPLLAEAERMGFLFDEDMLEGSPGGRGRAQAMVHWAGLMGGMESLLPAAGEAAPDRETFDDGEAQAGPLSPSLAVEEMQYPELMLDDVAPLVLAEDEVAFAAERDGRLDDELGDGPEEDLEADLDDDLEDVLDRSLADEAERLDAVGDAAGADLEFDEDTLGESDLTEPTAPLAAGRPEAVPRRAPPAVITPARPPAKPILAPPAAPPARPVVVLSKFRHVDAALPAVRSKAVNPEVGADRSSELARIPIVRVRREREPAKRVPFLARLLSSF